MKINIYNSNTTTEAINNAINLLEKQNTPNSEHIILVPDRFTLSQEKEIYQRLNLEGSFNIEVMSFSRFADSLIGRKAKFLSKEGTVMLMKKVLHKNMNIFSYYNKLNISYGFAREMFAVIASLRGSKISPNMLLEKTKNLDKHNKEKFEDIANIYLLYENALKEKYCDSISRYENLVEAIKTSNKVSQTHFYVFGFNVFSQIQLNIIKELCLFAVSFTIAVATDSGGANREIFYSKQLDELIEFAQKNNAKIQNNYFFSRLQSPFDTLNKELFAFTKVNNKNIKNKDSIVLFKQKNPYEEIKIVAKEIAFLVKKTARFKDIAVICCQQEYKKCIADIFKRCDIPFFIDEKYPSSQSLDAKYIFSIIEVVLYNYRMDKVINLIKHPYFGLTYEEADSFENFCLKYNINYSIFAQPFRYNDIERLEEIRAKLVMITEQISKKDNACAFSDKILNILIAKNYKDQDNVDIMYKASLQAEQKIIDLLIEIKEILNDEEIELEEYYSILIEGVNSLENVLIPQYLDSVFVGNTAESRYSDTKYMFVVGANEGFFPLKSGEQTILSYSDIINLKKCDIALSPNPMENNKLEKFVITDLMSRPNRLYVSCSDYNLLGERMLLGEAIKELSYILHLKIKDGISHNEFNGEQKLLYNLVCPENAYYEYMSGTIGDEYKDCVRDYLYQKGYKQRIEITGKELQESADFSDYFFLKDCEGNYTTKVSQLESYFCCPFRHYLNYGLKLKEREIAGLRVVDIGNIIHEILEVYFKTNLEKIRELGDEEIVLKAEQAIDKVLNREQIKNINTTYMGKNVLSNIKNECLYVINSLMQNIKNSSFTPKYIELAFDDKNKEFKATEIKTEKGVFKLRGKIDRVDLYNKKVAIIDYKTGNAEIADLKYIYYGKKIQLYVYMSIFTDNGYQAAGAFYLPIKDGYRSKKERFCFKGQIESNINTIKQFDNLLFDETRYTGGKVESEILSISASARKNGIEPNASNYLITEQDFINIIKYVKLMIKKAIEEISQGYCQRSPLDKECLYCSYKNHCSMSNIVQRVMESISIKVFECAGEENGMD